MYVSPPAITRAPSHLGQYFSRGRVDTGLSMADRFAKGMIIAAGAIFLLSVLLLIGGNLSDSFSKSAMMILVVLWVAVFLVTGIWTLYLMGQESVVCIVLALFVPFYSLYYLLSRWETMHRPFLIQIGGFIVLFIGGKTLAPQIDDPADSRGRSYVADTNGWLNGDDEDTGETDRPRSAAGGYKGPASPPSPIRETTDQSERPSVDEGQERPNRILQMVKDFAARDWRDSSREQATAQFASLKDSVEAERKQADMRVGGTGIAWSQIDSGMRTLQSRLSALPSEAADTVVFQDPKLPAVQWKPQRLTELADEVSFNNFRIRPPASARIDLDSSDTDAERGLVWSVGKEPAWTLTIKQSPKANPKQKQPWITTHPLAVQTADREQLLRIDPRQSTHAVGAIGGMTFWRIQPVQTRAGTVRYLASVGQDWLTIDLESEGGPESIGFLPLFDDVVRSLRPQKPGEPRASPFTPAQLAARLSDQPEQAIQRLRTHGSAAEAVVAPLLTSGDAAAARAAARFLAEFATAASLPSLRKAAESADTDLAMGARTALRRLVPDEFTAMTELLLDLKSTDATRRDAALEKIVQTDPVPAQRQEVATILEDLLLNGDVELELVTKALCSWYGDKTAVRLLPVLSKEDAEDARRDAAIDVIAATGDKAGAGAVIRWLLKEPDKTVAALIRMGLAAEDATQKLYNSIAMSRDAEHVAVRANCVRILSEVGTNTLSIQILARAVKDTRDPVTQEVAKAGIDSVKTRIAAKKP